MTRRPLVGEPLALDLVNTQWVERGHLVDLFDEPDGLRGWLTEHRLPGDPASVEAPLREVRAALRRVLEQPDDAAERAVNAILARGASRYTLRQGAVHEHHDVDPGWLPSWQAAVNYLELLRQQPNRIRRCGNPACVLHFYDTSRNGTRRWCSMDGCGARAKAARHYQRHRVT
ncbi:CGNR zinc finger domain-containing protein [Micromonospora sp. LAH09]|uniref:CGNR zinc finger domain-containing protein n=1 Tax=Micromonospora cabrerizensis TaxID=2911213 RepID=UPI001EE902F1|nr:CGNR zinc finger domain-containing protein [Micromonospora cabrerizensis]MCG5471683.1 CGNR zinc finger domain-containing protein [Micromonospora cabrerizensis]